MAEGFRIVVTCGASYEPIDGARRLTNMSTGRLGVTLTNYLTRAGHEVICLASESISYMKPIEAAQVIRFGTNADVARLLERMRERGPVEAVFHAAALCDYEVGEIEDGSGASLGASKISSRLGTIRMTLVPALKVLPRIREWLPESRVVGWKYELNGGREEAIAAAMGQIEACGSAGCVVNGAAYGEGYGFCRPGGGVEHASDLDSLGAMLDGFLREGRAG